MNRRWIRSSLVSGAIVGSFAAYAGAEVKEVIVRNFAFVPPMVTAAPGDTIRWVWESGVHTVTSGTPCTPDGLYFDAPMTRFNETAEFVVPDGVSQIPYFCILFNKR